MQRFLIAAASLALAFAVTTAPHSAQAQDASASPAPSPEMSAAPKLPVGTKTETFVVGDYLASPRVYNQLSQGSSGLASYADRFAAEFKVENFPFMLELEDDGFQYTHKAGPAGPCPRPGCVTAIGGATQTYIHSGTYRDYDQDVRIGFKIAKPRIYAVIAYIGRQSVLNYPVVNGLGLGFEKLPDYEKRVSIYASGYYYPDLQGKFTVQNRTTGATTIYTLTEHDIRYQAGVALTPFKGVPAFVDLGVLGDGIRAGAADPGNASHLSGYAGVGLYAK